MCSEQTAWACFLITACQCLKSVMSFYSGQTQQNSTHMSAKTDIFGNINRRYLFVLYSEGVLIKRT